MRITKRRARKEAFEHGFRSNFEFTFAKELKKYGLHAEYEAVKIKYEQPAITRNYCPDWKIKENVYIETKGIFTAADRKKLLNVRRCNPDITVYMLFMSSRNTLSKRSNTTYSDWCDKNNVEWADIREIKKWKNWFKKQ